MTAAEFLERFGHFVEAPDGVQRLRELILELAVQGKLVPQDPKDEPAPILLEKIQTEKLQLIADKKIRTTKPLQPVTDDEAPYALPTSWRWTRLGDLGDWGAGATPNRQDPSYYGGDMPWFKSGELTGEHISSAEENVTEKALRECSLRVCQPGDVLIAMYGATIGKVSVLDVEATTNQAVCACTSYSGVFNRFMLLLLSAYKFRFITQGAGGAQPNISKTKIVNTVAALPPLAEQHRIVAKVDELMALCERLEAERNARNETHTRLIRAVHHPLTDASDAASTATAWRRIRNNFAGLYTTRESVQALRQTILQLAVQGKLVPQDPSDETARHYLSRLAIKPMDVESRFQHAPSILHPLPSGWEWIRLRDLGAFKGGATPSKQSSRFWTGPIPWVSPKDMKIDLIGDSIDHISESAVAETAIKMIAPGALLMVTRGMILAHSFPVAITTSSVTINQDMKALELPEADLGKFLLVAMKGNRDRLLGLVQRSSHGTCRVDTSSLADFVLGIPPKPEQHRIVAKVDELMALCDQLEAAITSRDETARRYAEAVVQQLSAA